MSDHYLKEKPMEKCPLSKTEDGSCRQVVARAGVYEDTDKKLGIGILCKALDNIRIGGGAMRNMEVCPCASKNLPVKSEWDLKIEKAYQKFSDMLKAVNCGIGMHKFKEIIKEAGLE